MLKIAIFFSFLKLVAQPIPHGTYAHEGLKIYHNSGLYWNNVSSINSIRRGDIVLTDDNTTYVPSTFSKFLYTNRNLIINTHGAHNYKSDFYSFYNISLIKNDQSKQTLSNNQIEVRLNSSGIGFQNDWVTFQLGKGIENWRSGVNIDLLLSENSVPYDYLMLSSNYGKVRVNYIHGFLEKLNNGNNRYLMARGIEWSNNKDKVISLSETVIYAGTNRSIDFGYLNPIGSHLEVELNERLNRIGTNYSNAAWQLHLDFLLNTSLRLSINFLIDEFVFDQDIEVGKEHGSAFSSKICSSNIFNENNLISLYISYLKIGTPVLRHSNGYLNFVNNEKPLGWIYGSDGDEINLGTTFFRKEAFIFDLSLSYVRYGEESILERPYEAYFDYLGGEFPSGKISKVFAFKTNIHYVLNDNISIVCNSILDYHKQDNVTINFGLGFLINSKNK